MVELWMVFYKFFKIGITAFGGGSVILSLIQKDFVETGLISTSQFIHILTLSQATPGPIAGSAATYIGYQLHGILGIITANIAIALPSYFIVLGFSNFLKKHKEHKAVDDVFKVLRPITIALIVSMLIYLIRISIFNDSNVNSIHQLAANFSWRAAIIFSITTILMGKFKINPAYIALIAGVLGVLIL